MGFLGIQPVAETAWRIVARGVEQISRLTDVVFRPHA